MRFTQVRRSIAADKVRQHIDLVSIEGAGRSNARDGDTDVWLRIIAQDEGVGDGEHELLLAEWRVLLSGDEGGVVVADGDIFGTSGGDAVEDREREGRENREPHVDGRVADRSDEDDGSC